MAHHPENTDETSSGGWPVGTRVYAAENLVVVDGSLLARWGDALLVEKVEPGPDEGASGKDDSHSTMIRVRVVEDCNNGRAGGQQVACISPMLLSKEPPRLNA